MNSKIDEILEQFTALANEEKLISSDLDAAYKDYNDFLRGSDEDLSKKIHEIREKMSKLDVYIDYAKTHAHGDELEEATTPFETSDGQLESLRQTIKLDSHSDPNAESLYTKATGQKLFYEKKIEDTKKLIENSKIQARRQYENSANVLNERKRNLDQKMMSYIQSESFREYLHLLSFDKSAFNSPGTVQLPDNSAISLGQRRVKLVISQDAEQEITLASNGEYNAASHTIGAPFKISMKKGSVMFLDFDDRNKQYLLGGIQRLLLNSLKYCGDNIRDIFFCEPNGNSPESLGTMASLGKGVNPFITIPISGDDIDGKIAEYTSRIEMSPTPDSVSRIMVLNNFSEKYSENTRARILYLCKNAERYGVLIVLTHNNVTGDTEYEREIRSMAVSVRSMNGGFYIEKLRESLFWYSAPSELPDDIRRVYVEQRRAKATQNGNSMRLTDTPVRQAPTNSPLYQEPPVLNQSPYQQPFSQQTIPPYGMSNPAVQQYGMPAPSMQQYGMPNPAMQQNGMPNPAMRQNGISNPAMQQNIPQNNLSNPYGFTERSAPFGMAEPPIQPAPACGTAETAAPASEPPAPVETVSAPAAESKSVETEKSIPDTKIETHIDKEETISEPEQPEEPEDETETVLRKGSRKLASVSLGTNKSGKHAKIDINGGVTCICGNPGKERQNCVDKIINGIVNTSHPDDAELWIFDFEGSLMERAERMPAHIKYLIVDDSVDFSLDIIDSLSAEFASRVKSMMSAKIKDFSEMPSDRFIPNIVVVINNFAAMYDNICNSSKFFGKDNMHILTRLFKKCASAGIHFILISSTFTSNGELFPCLKDGIVCSAAASDGKILDIHALVEAAGAGDFAMPKKIPEGRILIVGNNGVSPAKLSENEPPAQTGYIPVFEYSDEQEEYVAKNALISNRLTHIAFEEQNEVLREMIADVSDGEKLIFAGEPCRLTRSYPISLCEDFGENLFALVPSRDKQNSAAVVGAVILSLIEQNVSVELLSSRSNPIYAELLRTGMLQGVNVFEGDQVILHIKELSSTLNSTIHANKVVIVLGGDMLMAAMHAADSVTELKKLLVKGPYKGIHLFLVSSGSAQFASGFIALFRHRIVFPCPAAEAAKLLRNPERELPETGFIYSDDYDELTMKPFLI